MIVSPNDKHAIHNIVIRPRLAHHFISGVTVIQFEQQLTKLMKKNTNSVSCEVYRSRVTDRVIHNYNTSRKCHKRVEISPVDPVLAFRTFHTTASGVCSTHTARVPVASPLFSFELHLEMS